MKIWYNRIKFHSKIERDVYIVLSKYFDNSQFERQKQYFPNRKFTCDFYFGNLNPPTWIEVSSYKGKRYLAKIRKKQYWVESRGDKFLFVNNPLILENKLSNWFNTKIAE